MNTYVIRRRSNWKDAAELEAAGARSTKVGDDDMPTQVRWIRTYVVQEADGRLGSICIYQATGPEAIREHARRAGLQADEIISVANTVVVRDDPDAAA
ncbi:MAG TPA: DUF4242 domain-containing protein [Woeseiaceae bacterium]|nr:DUF4242 domain-containing protein [Woeseiaceae bacterium]